jgi:hypothetical protein
LSRSFGLGRSRNGEKVGSFLLESVVRLKRCRFYLFGACENEKVLPLLTLSFLGLEKREKVTALDGYVSVMVKPKVAESFCVYSRVRVSCVSRKI